MTFAFLVATQKGCRGLCSEEKLPNPRSQPDNEQSSSAEGAMEAAMGKSVVACILLAPESAIVMYAPLLNYTLPTGHENACNSVTFAPSGEKMLSTDADGVYCACPALCAHAVVSIQRGLTLQQEKGQPGCSASRTVFWPSGLVFLSPRPMFKLPVGSLRPGYVCLLMALLFGSIWHLAECPRWALSCQFTIPQKCTLNNLRPFLGARVTPINSAQCLPWQGAAPSLAC